MTVVYHDYVRQIPLSLDLALLKNTCTQINSELSTMFSSSDIDHFIKRNYDQSIVPFSTSLLTRYNVLCFPYPGMYELYAAIRSEFRKLVSNDEPYYIGAWLNLYEKGQSSDWHSHGISELNAWHGYFAINAEPSVTTYKISGVPEDVNIVNKNNTLILSVTGKDKHIAQPWEVDNEPKITIAYDIMPQKNLLETYTNFWIPI